MEKIENIAKQARGSIAVFDIDGTLADIEHRIQELDPGTPPHWDPGFDWKGFFHRFEHDKPIEWTVNLAKTLKNDAMMHLMIFTGRSEVVREETEHWLEGIGLLYDFLIMRGADDYRMDEEIKLHLLEPYRERIAFVVEDRNKIAASLRDSGYNVLQCAYCDY